MRRRITAVLLLIVWLTSFAATPLPRPVHPASSLAQSEPLMTWLVSDQINPNEPLVFNFSQQMDPASADPALFVYPYLPGKITWNPEYTQASFKPVAGFKPGENYYVYLVSELHSAGGEAFPIIQEWWVQVSPALAVTEITPKIYDLSTLRPRFDLTFSQNVDPERIRRSLRFEPPVKFSVAGRNANVSIQVEEPLQVSVPIQIILEDSDPSQVEQPLDQTYIWEFQPRPLIKDIRCYKDRISLSFNYPLRLPEDIGAIFDVDKTDGSWRVGSPNTLFFDAEKWLVPGQTYAVQTRSTLTGTKDEPLGQPKPVECIPEIPIVESTLVEERYHVTGVSITFDLLVDRAITESAFSIDPPIPGKIVWTKVGSNREKLIYQFDHEPPTGNYQVSISEQARGINSEVFLNKPFKWSFSQYSYNLDSRPVSFHEYGRNLQIVDANSRRAVQFTARQEGLAVQFDFYSLEMHRFAALYRDSFGWSSAYNPKLIDLTGIDPTASYTVQTVLGVNDVLLPQDTPPGLFILNMRTGQTVVDQLFVVLTANTLIVKRSDRRLFAWASDINGTSQPGLEVRIYNDLGEAVATGETDSQGTYRATLPAQNTALLVMARSEDGDITISGAHDGWGSYDNWWQDYYYQAFFPLPNNTVDIYGFTDRPIYRPGQSVAFKAFIRADNDVRYSLPPSGTKVQAVLRDPRSNLIDTRELILNSFGGVDGAFDLADEIALGEYAIEIQVEGETESIYFQVEEYHKSDLQITAAADREVYIQGEPVNLDVELGYLFGQPLPNTKFAVTIFQVGNSWYGNYWRFSQERTFVTDATGKSEVSLTASSGDEYAAIERSGSLYTSQMAAVIKVESGPDTATAVVRFKVHNASEKLILDPIPEDAKPGDKVELTARLTTLDGEPVADRQVGFVIDNNVEEDRLIFPAGGKAITDADGLLRFEVPISKGSHEVKLQFRTPDQVRVNMTSWFYVTMNGIYQYQAYERDLQIFADKTSYEPYESARFKIESTFSGPALLTFERQSVIHSIPVTLTAPLTEVEAQIIPEYGPNVKVKINAWKALDITPTQPSEDYYYYRVDRPNTTLITDHLELDVSVRNKALNLRISSNQSEYAPGDRAAFTIFVTDQDNEPVEAELAVSLVDEAIFNLANDKTIPMYNAYYGPRDITVQTFYSFAISRYSTSPDRGGGGGEFLDGPSGPRFNFPDTAVWLPTVRTDSNGRADIALTLPDTLTTWRLTARAITLRTQVGETTAAVKTRRAVTLDPALPEVLTTGDRVALKATLHNLTNFERTFQVRMKTEGVILETPTEQTVTVPGNASLPIHWWATAVQAGGFTAEFSAIDRYGVGDSIQLPLRIRQRAISTITTQTGSFLETLKTTLLMPEPALPTSHVTLRLERSLAGPVLNGLEYLTGYPYGCVEQTMSRALPNAVVGRTLTRLGIERSASLADLDEKIRVGLTQLYGMQHSDGGWGWWADDDSDEYQTAWVLFGLATTRDAGYPVEPRVLTAAGSYLKARLGISVEQDSESGYRRPDDAIPVNDPTLRAFILYSLAVSGQGVVPETLEAYDDYTLIDTFGQAALALSLDLLGRSTEAKDMVDHLENTARRVNDMVLWPTAYDTEGYSAKMMSSTVRTTALVLTALQTLDPTSDLITPAVKYLMFRHTGRGWGSTNETAFSLLALTDNLVAVGNEIDGQSYQVLLNDREIVSGTWTPGQVRMEIEISAGDMQPNLNSLNITQNGNQSLFYTVLSEVSFDQQRTAAVGPLKITREYLNVDNTAVKKFTPNLLVKIRLTISLPTRNMRYLMVEDPLPAGLRALNEKLNNDSRFIPSKRSIYWDAEEGISRSYWRDYGYNQKQIRDGRVTFFITDPWSIYSNTLVLTYYARVVQAGTFTALPSEVSAMYDIAQWGRSDSIQIEISE